MDDIDELVSANYRVDNRNPPRAGVTATCRRPSRVESRPDIAVSLQDVTDVGVGITVRQVVRLNDLLEVGLSAPGWTAPVVRVGRVVWTDLLTPTFCRAGVLFADALTFEQLEQLSHLPGPH